MLRPVRLPAAQAAIATVLVFAACGGSGSSPEEEVRAAVTEFGRATAAKDYQALCDRILASSLTEQLRSIGLPCEVALRQGLGDVSEPQLTVGAVRVDGNRATAEVRTSAAGQEPSRDTLRLVNEDGAWKIASLGSG
jgi:Putative lumazine-binding